MTDFTPLERLARVEALLCEQSKQLARLVELTEKNTNFRTFMAGIGTIAGALAGAVTTIVLTLMGLRN